MNPNRIISGFAMTFLAVSVHATNSQPNLSGPAFQSLNTMAASSAESAAEAMDGSVPRQEGNLTIIKEDPNWQRTSYHPPYSTTVCDYRDRHDPYYGGRSGRDPRHQDGHHHDGHYRQRYCYDVHHPGYNELERGTWQQVQITDREGYKREMTKKGAFWGGLVGAAALLLLALSGPVGIAVAVGLGVAAAGTAIGYGYAATKSKVFTRVVDQTSTRLP